MIAIERKKRTETSKSVTYVLHGQFQHTLADIIIGCQGVPDCYYYTIDGKTEYAVGHMASVVIYFLRNSLLSKTMEKTNFRKWYK